MRSAPDIPADMLDQRKDAKMLGPGAYIHRRHLAGRSTHLAVLGVTCFLFGCAPLPAPVNYSPSSALTASGSVTVGDFKYLPALSGKVAPNQLRNTAMGDIKINANVNDYFREAVFKEFRFVGIKVDGKDRVITGEIKDYLIDDLGYSVDWTVDVQYTVTDTQTGKVLYTSEKITKDHTAKFMNAFETINAQIRRNIEALLNDPEFLRAIAA
jgi:uncharacterized lipoprotein